MPRSRIGCQVNWLSETDLYTGVVWCRDADGAERVVYRTGRSPYHGDVRSAMIAWIDENTDGNA